MKTLARVLPIWAIGLVACTDIAGDEDVDYIGCYTAERSTIELTDDNEIFVDGRFAARFNADERPGDVTIRSDPLVEFLLRDGRVIVQPEPDQLLLGAFNTLPEGTIGQFYSTGDDEGVVIAMKADDSACD